MPADIVFLVVLWRLRPPLGLRHLAEMFLGRGLAFTHEAVREWETLVVLCCAIAGSAAPAL